MIVIPTLDTIPLGQRCPIPDFTCGRAANVPCMPTIAVSQRETQSWERNLFRLGNLVNLGWLLTSPKDQAGRLF